MKNLAVLIGLLVFVQVAYSKPSGQRAVGNYGASHITQFPFEVSIRRRFCDGCAYEHYCSGAIYSAKVIITAASCVRDANVQRTQVVAGTSKTTTSAKDGQIYLVEQIISHDHLEIDIALLHLTLELQFNGLTIMPVTLATEQPKVGKKALVAGWGQSSEFEANFEENIKAIEVPILDVTSCKAAYFWTDIKDTEICAGYLQGGTDACRGDAGSPLMLDNKMVGLVSWGYGCARRGNPGVYTNVIMLKDWIVQNA